MYEKRNHDLDEELRRLQSELHRAKEILAQVDKHWNKPTHFEKVQNSFNSLKFRVFGSRKGSLYIYGNKTAEFCCKQFIEL